MIGMCSVCMDGTCRRLPWVTGRSEVVTACCIRGGWRLCDGDPAWVHQRPPRVPARAATRAVIKNKTIKNLTWHLSPRPSSQVRTLDFFLSWSMQPSACGRLSDWLWGRARLHNCVYQTLTANKRKSNRKVKVLEWNFSLFFFPQVKIYSLMNPGRMFAELCGQIL